MKTQKGQSVILVLIGLLVLAAVVGGVYFFGKSQTPKPLTQNTEVVSQTPQPTTGVSSPVQTGTDETASWKTYTNNLLKVTFKYPEKWNLNVTGEESFISVSESKNELVNQIIVTDIFKTFFIESVLNEYKSKSKTAEFLIKEYQAYNLYSTSGWADARPREIRKDQILIDGIGATKYLIKFDEPKDIKFKQITWIFVPFEDKILNIRLEGVDENILNQILSTFKFTQ